MNVATLKKVKVFLQTPDAMEFNTRVLFLLFESDMDHLAAVFASNDYIF